MVVGREILGRLLPKSLLINKFSPATPLKGVGVHLKKDMAKNADQEFVEFVIKSIVDHPDDVKTDRSVDEMGVLLTLKVNPEDMGQVIGRQGGTARAIRTLLRVIGAKHNARVNFKIEEPEGGRVARARSESAAKDVDQVVDELKL
jgi:predicted RNA-binding protein YlqC (UPF0109 family)